MEAIATDARPVIPVLSGWLRPALIVTGALVIALALIAAITTAPPADVLGWLWRVFGPVFAIGYLLLLAVHALALRAVLRNDPKPFWPEAGNQAAAGMATLALTFTLLGISLGIGGLANTPLSPDTVQAVIAELTGHFSTAFMTTVVGLPTAAAMRASLALTLAQRGRTLAASTSQGGD